MTTRSRIQRFRVVCAVGVITSVLIFGAFVFLFRPKSEEPIISHAPNIMADSRGNVHIVWQAGTHGRHKIYYVKMGDADRPEPEIISGTASSQNPSLAIDGSGGVYVVWQVKTGNASVIFFAERTAETWMKPIPLSPTSLIAEDPAIAADDEGHVHVVWQGLADPNPRYEIYYSEWDGELWKAPIVVSSSEKPSRDSAYHPAITARHGVIHIIWQASTHIVDTSKAEICYTRIDRNGIADPKNLSNSSGNSLWPRICVDSLGDAHAVWLDDTSGNNEICYARGNDQGWSDSINISNSTGSSALPSIATDLQDNVHVVWTEYSQNKSEVYYSKYDESSWSQPLSISEELSYSSRPAVTTYDMDQVYVVWESIEKETSSIYYRWYNGEEWSILNEIPHTLRLCLSFQSADSPMAVRKVTSARFKVLQ